jgi:hypothetical protein
MVNCDWCGIVKAKGITCEFATCDFKTIPMTKEGILKRMQEESDNVYVLKMRVVNERLSISQVREVVVQTFDKAKGLDVMMSVLKEKFGMSDEKILSSLDRKKLTSMQSTQFVIKTLEATRGGK